MEHWSNTIGGQAGAGLSETAMPWVLNISDGSNSLLDKANRSEIRFNALARATTALQEHHLLPEYLEFVPSAAHRAGGKQD